MSAKIWHRFTLATILVAIFAARSGAAETVQSVADLTSDYQQLTAAFVADLEALAQRAETNGWAQMADFARRWRPLSPASGRLLFVAPDQYSPDRVTPALREAAAKETTNGEWASVFVALREQRADALFTLARQAAEAGQLSLAFTWANEAVRENPDHSEARRVLGYERLGDEWLTEFAAQKLEAGDTWHSQFGWIDAADVERYEAGERPRGDRWISAEVDARRHEGIEDGWQVLTDHFLVTTNHSPAAAVEFATQLERLHQLWRQLFAGYYLTEREVRELFNGERDPRKSRRPMRVFYHRDKSGYVDELVRRQPRIAETLGIYFDTDREAHFFAGDEADMATLNHEAVHQLFAESRSVDRHFGEAANFWIIEGVATYFETLADHADLYAGRFFTIGESAAGRLPAARQRMLKDGFFVPLGELVQLGKDEVQGRSDLAKLYGQTAALATFFLDADEGRYREPLVQYLVAVYDGEDDAGTLAELAGESYQQLDRQFKQHLQILP